jgi:hypothetical protein
VIEIHAYRSAVRSHDFHFKAILDEVAIPFWPGIFYTMLIETGDPIRRVIAIWAIAALSNAVLYGFVGWLVWRLIAYIRIAK